LIEVVVVHLAMGKCRLLGKEKGRGPLLSCCKAPK